MDAEARNEIAHLLAKFLGLREIVAQLVAHEASRAADSDAFLEQILENIDARIADVSQKMSSPSMPLEETTRREVDWVVDAARRLLG